MEVNRYKKNNFLARVNNERSVNTCPREKT